MSELNPCVSCGAHVPEAQAPPFPGHADDCALRTSWLSRPSYDDPETDGTDYAHPAWWRGNDAGVAGAVRIINEALDGPIPASGCVGGQELEVCRRRVEALRQENARLEALIVGWFVKQSGAPADALVGEALRVIRDREPGSRMPDPREKE